MGDHYLVDALGTGTAALHDRLHRDVVAREHAGHGFQNARTVGHRETQVIAHDQLVHGQDGQVVGAGAAHNGSHALLNVARNFQHVAHDGASRGTRAGALAEEHGLAHEVAHHVNGVEHAVYGGQLMVRRDHGGMHAHIDPILAAMGDGQKLDDVAHVASCLDIHRRDVRDAVGENIVQGHTRVEGDGRQDGDLRRRVEAAHVRRGIGLGEALLLRLVQGVLVGQAVVGHAGEHVVGGAVHNAHDRGDLVGDERVLQRIDDGDAAAHGRFEGQFLASSLGGFHNLLAVGGHECLVGRNHVLAGGERVQYDRAGDGGAPDELHHDIDLGIVDDVVEVVGEQVADPVGLGLGRRQRAHARQLDIHTEVTQEVVLVLLDDVDAPAADGAGAHQADFHCHVTSSPERESSL